MIKLLSIILCFTFSPAFLFCQQKDSIFLYNGQVLIGDIKNAKIGIITIDDVDLKLINIKLYKIKQVNTAHIFRIETNEKQTYFGKIIRSVKDGWTNIQISNDSIIPLEITGISSLVFLEKTFFRRLDGNIGAGFSYNKSSSIGQVNMNATVSYATKSFENQLKVSAIGSIDSSRYSRDNENAELFSNYNLNSTWFLSGLLAYQRNLELSLARRFQEMLGGGDKLFVKNDWQLKIISGVAFNQEKSTDGSTSGILVELPIMLRFNFYKFQHPNLQISSTQTTFFSVTEKGRFRFNGSTDFSWELVHNFSFTLSLYNNYDNKPPPGTASNVDYGVVAGLSYKF